MKRTLIIAAAILAAALVGAPAYADPSDAPSVSAPVSEPASSPTSTPASHAPDKCAAYLYLGSKRTLCDRFGNEDTLTCAQVGFKVKLIHKGVDPWGLDGHRGTRGVGCEGNASATPSSTPAPSTSPTAAEAAGPSLPVTGPGVGVLALGGATALLAGTGVLLAARRRRRFTA